MARSTRKEINRVTSSDDTGIFVLGIGIYIGMADIQNLPDVFVMEASSLDGQVFEATLLSCIIFLVFIVDVAWYYGSLRVDGMAKAIPEEAETYGTPSDG